MEISKEYMLGKDYSLIGMAVHSEANCSESVWKELVSEAVIIARRKFKLENVVIYVDTDEYGEQETGIVFTTEKMVVWRNTGKVVQEIPYESIDDVDFDEKNTIITVGGVGGEVIKLELGPNAEDEKYSRYMYNFISELLEYNPS